MHIYGLISNVKINPKEVPVACDLIELVIYDVHVMGGGYFYCIPGLSSQHDNKLKSCSQEWHQ